MTGFLPAACGLLMSAVTLDDPPLVAVLHTLAQSLPGPLDLSGPPGLEFLKAYEAAGRPQAYISSWKEGPALNDALARAAAYRGLTATATELSKLAGKGFPALPASLAEPPEKGPELAFPPYHSVLLAWPFEDSHLQGRRLLGAPIEMLRPAEGDVISGRVFRLVRENSENFFDLEALVNPWGKSGALASFVVFTPQEVDIGLRVEGEGDARILSGEGLAKGWRVVLIYVKPRGEGPLDSRESWTLSISLAGNILGHFFQSAPESFGDELAGYLSWCGGESEDSLKASLMMPPLQTSSVEESVAEALALDLGASPLKPWEGSNPWVRTLGQALEKARQGQIPKARKLLTGILSESRIAPGLRGILSRLAEALVIHGDKGGPFRWNPEQDGLEGTRSGRAAWGRAWMAKGYERAVSARGRKGEDYNLIADGRTDTFIPLKKGETWIVLDLGELAGPASVALFLDRPALATAVVEASKDGGHYALLGEFKDLGDKKIIELAPDPGGSYRMLRLVLTTESDSALLREVLVSYTQPSAIRPSP